MLKKKIYKSKIGIFIHFKGILASNPDYGKIVYASNEYYGKTIRKIVCRVKWASGTYDIFNWTYLTSSNQCRILKNENEIKEAKLAFIK